MQENVVLENLINKLHIQESILEGLVNNIAEGELLYGEWEDKMDALVDEEMRLESELDEIKNEQESAHEYMGLVVDEIEQLKHHKQNIEATISQLNSLIEEARRDDADPKEMYSRASDDVYEYEGFTQEYEDA